VDLLAGALEEFPEVAPFDPGVVHARGALGQQATEIAAALYADQLLTGSITRSGEEQAEALERAGRGDEAGAVFDRAVDLLSDADETAADQVRRAREGRLRTR